MRRSHRRAFVVCVRTAWYCGKDIDAWSTKVHRGRTIIRESGEGIGIVSRSNSNDDVCEAAVSGAKLSQTVIVDPVVSGGGNEQHAIAVSSDHFIVDSLRKSR